MIKPAIKPAGWNHPSLNLHRQWHVRHGLSLRARQALILLVPAAILMWVFSSPWWLLLALLGLIWNPAWLPFQWHEQRTLEVVSEQHGDAYATALIAPTDPFGFSKRLESQAQNIERNAELPNLPWLEVLIAGAIVSLVWLIPARGITTGSEGTAPTATNLERRMPAETLPENDPGVTGAPVTNPAPQGQTQSSSPTGSGGTAGVGATRPGANNSGGAPTTESNEDISREFGQALERGAVRTSPSAPAPNKQDGKKPDDRTASDGSSDGSGNPGGNARRGSGSNQSNGSQPGGSQDRNGQKRDNPGQSGGKPGDQNAPASSQNQPGKQSGGQSQPSPSNRDNRGQRGQGQADDGSDFGGMNPGQKGNDPNGQARNTPGGKGTTGAGKPQSVPEADGAGKLEYLPGETKRNISRSGALPLPGDSSRTLPAGSSNEPYRRAAESAVLDPRLPPEYQELLKQYYR
jgi:hypothetical protein